MMGGASAAERIEELTAERDRLLDLVADYEDRLRMINAASAPRPVSD